MKRFFTVLLAVSLLCACGDVEPFPGLGGDGDKVENEGGSGSTDNDNSGDDGGNTGEGESGGNSGDNNEGGDEGGSNEGNTGDGSDTPVEQSEIVILPTSNGWCTTYPTSQTVYKIDDYEYYLLNAAIYNESNGMQFKKQTGYIANKQSLANLQRISIVQKATSTGKMSLYVGSGELPAETAITATESDYTFVFNCSGYNASYFKLVNESGNVVYLTEIRITYGGTSEGGGNGGGSTEGGEDDSGSSDGDGSDDGGGSTTTPDPDPTPNPSIGGVYRSGWAELPVEEENSDYYYAHHTVTDVKNSEGENARNYTVCYSANHHCPVWVAAPRHDFWTGSASKAGYSVDPDIPSSIQPSSGAKIGNDSYNRGHMLGNSDRSRSSQMRRQVSYYTNIALQLGSTFNTGGGAWNNLEDHIDAFAKSDTLYMVVGSYFDAWTDKYGNSKPVMRVDFGGKDSSVPTMFWAALLRTKESAKGKAVWNCTADELRCVGFTISHAMPKGHKPEAKDMISISELEKLVGVTLFPNVPNAPKSTYNASDWGL